MDRAVSWALVLSGGGTSSLAWQIGLLAGLREGGADLTRPTLVVGTSAGAIAGAHVAAGRGLGDLFARLCAPGTVAVSARGCLAEAEPWPDVPLHLTTLDAESGTLRVWTRSSGVPLADAVATSCATPFVDAPQAIEGRVYRGADAVSPTSAQLAFGHRLVIVIAGLPLHGADILDDEVAQLRAGGSHAHVIRPAAAAVLRPDPLEPGGAAASAEAGYTQGLSLAAAVGTWLESCDALVPVVDVEDLSARFAVPSLRKAEWTHVAHLAVGAWYVDRYGAEDALTRLRDGIRRLNVSIGGANTPSAGYHETITAAYVRLLGAFLEASPPGLPLAARVDRLLASPLVERDMLFTFYSRERLLSPEARARWVDPDLAPLRLDAVAGSRST